MPSFTREAIKRSFLKLLNERPISKITVKNIVEDCGINRNSFYYHFQDLPSLVEEIVLDDAEKIIAEKAVNNSLEECLDTIIDFALHNKKAALHIYNSASREMFERYLSRICEFAVTEYIKTAFPNIAASEDDMSVLVKFVKCELFGQTIEWLNDGMKYDLRDELHRLNKLFGDTPEKIIKKLEKNNY